MKLNSIHITVIKADSTKTYSLHTISYEKVFNYMLTHMDEFTDAKSITLELFK